MPVHCQRVLRADVPTVNRFKGASSPKKVTQDHEIVRKIGKRADYQNAGGLMLRKQITNRVKGAEKTKRVSKRATVMQATTLTVDLAAY